MLRRLLPGLAAVFLLAPLPARAGDWPMARYDAGRSNASPDALPARLHLQWVREYPVLEPAWDDQPKMHFDSIYEPVVLGKRMFVGSPLTDSVVALDTDSGAEKWRFMADGPVRFAPVAWRDKIYFASDDGHLYCVDAFTGSLKWKFRGAPLDRRILGNERLISIWPARGAPVIENGTLYFAAGIWPFMGIFIYALDAESGQVVWSNSGDGAIFMKQPHSADAFAAVAPQGELVAFGDRLLIPGGRSLPALYDKKTGKMIRYQLADNGKRGGGSEVTAGGKFFFNGGALFETESQKFMTTVGELLAVRGDVLFSCRGNKIEALNLKTAGMKTEETVDRKGAKVKITKWYCETLGQVDVKGVKAMMVAGSRLYVGGDRRVAAYHLPLPADRDDDAELVWEAKVNGTVERLLAADDKLFAVTQEGQIYCFGGDSVVAPKTWSLSPAPETILGPDTTSSPAKAILDAAKVRDGWCVAWGVGSGKLITDLVRQSNLHVIVIEADEGKVDKFRRELIAAGLYGSRIAVHVGEASTFPLPPYLASLMVAERAEDVDLRPDGVKRMFQALRPYGGVACLPLTGDKLAELQKVVDKTELANARVRENDGHALLVREGALPGSANWTHEHADAANTRVSRDLLVKAPMGLLWFGGPSHDGILPRHGHGPQPQVVDGRVLIQGIDMIRCLDIYTGRQLWETRLPNVGYFYNNTAHQPGANASGTNFISTSDGIYVVHGMKCVRLDPATGQKTAEFQLPLLPGMKETPRWGYINVEGDLLVGGADPLFDPALFKPLLAPGAGDDKDPDDKTKTEPKPMDNLIGKVLTTLAKGGNDNMSSSKHLVAMDRQTGKVKWTATAKHGFRHNAVCIGGGRLYAIDRLSGPQVDRLKRRGEAPTQPNRLVVLDLKTGKELWSSSEDVFGTWLSYSEKHDVLVEAGRPAGDTMPDEAKGMRVYTAGDGQLLWHQKSHSGPAMIHHDEILNASGAGYELLTGKLKMRIDPLTGQAVPWKWARAYGCNTPMASEHLLTFRSGAAGFYDLCNDGGTGNWGGFRSSCTNNLIVAGGVVCAPDYTRTCTCLYQNQTSLALVHMPDAELWTYFGPQQSKGALKRVGINLGAPGDRRADDGNLWLEYPGVGGRSPTLALKITGDKLEYFRKHSALVEGDLNWVAASGLKGAKSISIPVLVTSTEVPTLWHWIGQTMLPIPAGPTFLMGLPKMEVPKEAPGPSVNGRYTVRLHFMEPDNTRPGQRVFDVLIQGNKGLTDFDIVKEAGASNRALVKEFKGVMVAKELTLTFEAKKGVPLLCGIDIIAE